MALVNVDSWLMEYESVDKLAREIQSQLSQRNQNNFHKVNSKIRAQIKQLSNELGQLQRNLSDLVDSRAITRDEGERRLRQIEQLQSKLFHLEKQFQVSLKNPNVQ